MSTAISNIDLGGLLRLRLVLAGDGRMNALRWWNAGDAAGRARLQGGAGSVLVGPGFPRTYRFAQVCLDLRGGLRAAWQGLRSARMRSRLQPPTTSSKNAGLGGSRNATSGLTS